MSLENNSENKFADVPIRVKTWVYIVFAFAAGISHPFLMKIFVGWISFQSFREFLKMIAPKNNSLFPAIILGIAQFLFLYLFYYQYFFMINLIFLIIFGIILIQILKLSFNQIFYLFLGLLICLICFSHLYFIRNIHSEFQNSKAIFLIIFVVVVTELNDVFQYLMGKFFGKNKIVPKISPNKTVEGFLGGLFLTIILSNILGYFLLNFTIFVSTILGIILGILGFFGDILMSFLKRKFKIKDTGNLLPGHGGLLDRMDSLIFNAPIFYFLIKFLMII